MKKSIIYYLLALFMVCGYTQAYAQKTYVLIAGISNYPGEKSDVGQTTKDAKKMARFWQKRTPNVVLLTSSYVTTENIKQKLTEISEAATEDDVIIFFYAGHGAKNYLVLHDTVFPYRRLLNILQKSKAKAKICFLNACFSGSIFEAAKQNPDDAFVLFASSRENEESIEERNLGAGFFSQALIKGLVGQCDYNKDKIITVKELFAFIQKDIANRTNQQHPQVYAHKKMHDFPIVDWNLEESKHSQTPSSEVNHQGSGNITE